MSTTRRISSQRSATLTTIRMRPVLVGISLLMRSWSAGRMSDDIFRRQSVTHCLEIPLWNACSSCLGLRPETGRLPGAQGSVLEWEVVEWSIHGGNHRDSKEADTEKIYQKPGAWDQSCAGFADQSGTTELVECKEIGEANIYLMVPLSFCVESGRTIVLSFLVVKW